MISLISILVKFVTTCYQRCHVTHHLYLVHAAILARRLHFLPLAALSVEIPPWRPQEKKFHAWWAVLVPATCSESAAAAARRGGGGGVKIYACLLCHPENAEITAFRCQRKYRGWCWGWKAVRLDWLFQTAQMIDCSPGVLNFHHAKRVALVGARVMGTRYHIKTGVCMTAVQENIT